MKRRLSVNRDEFPNDDADPESEPKPIPSSYLSLPPELITLLQQDDNRKPKTRKTSRSIKEFQVIVYATQLPTKVNKFGHIGGSFYRASLTLNDIRLLATDPSIRKIEVNNKQ